MNDDQETYGPPRPLPPRYEGDTLNRGVMMRIQRGGADSFTDALAVGFYASSGRQYREAVEEWMRFRGIDRSRFFAVGSARPRD